MDITELIKKNPIIKNISEGEEVCWINPNATNFKSAIENLSVHEADIDDAEKRLQRFSSFIQTCFPETAETNGLIESPLQEIGAMKKRLQCDYGVRIYGKLLLKRDSDLAVAGSVKARGGIYEILKYAEDLALQHNKIHVNDDYSKFADSAMKAFFSEYTIHVGSTGNLGLSIGIISAALGFTVFVHMSADAKQWKKELLRSKGVNVIEYAGDYGKAVEEGRRRAASDPKSYFVDDENSKNLFLGYAVAAKRLKKQLEEKNIKIDSDHPLFLFIPCGVGGAPGGLTFGIKHIYKDNVHVFYIEPTQACCMLLGLITGMHDRICVQDVHLSGKTEADGLAVSRPSKFVGKTIYKMVAGECTVKDERLYRYMKALSDTENIFIEPSSCAIFEGVVQLAKSSVFQDYLAEQRLSDKMENSIQIAWATGGRLVPESVKNEYYKKASDLEHRSKS